MKPMCRSSHRGWPRRSRSLGPSTRSKNASSCFRLNPRLNSRVGVTSGSFIHCSAFSKCSVRSGGRAERARLSIPRKRLSSVRALPKSKSLGLFGGADQCSGLRLSACCQSSPRSARVFLHKGQAVAARGPLRRGRDSGLLIWAAIWVGWRGCYVLGRDWVWRILVGADETTRVGNGNGTFRDYRDHLALTRRKVPFPKHYYLLSPKGPRASAT